MKDEQKSTVSGITPGASWLQTFPGCQHYSNERAELIIESLLVFASLLLESSLCAEQAETAGEIQRDAIIIPLLPKQKAA